MYGDIGIANKSDDRCVLFFVKYPKEGEVKERLSAALGETMTVELYRNFVLDLLSTLEKLGSRFWICFYPDNLQEKFKRWLGMQYCYMPQKGEDLGQRMKNSFIQAFAEGFQRVIIIGSDIPDLPGTIINEAFLFLETHDAVVGPSFDGGYYLIGFRYNNFSPRVFEGINWSTDTVFQETMKILKKAGCKIHVLPEWRDIDTLADLKDLFQRNRDTEFKSSRTISYSLKYEKMFK